MLVVHVVAVVVGATMTLAVLADVVFTVLHPDVEGVIAHRLQRWVWAVAVRATPGRVGNRLVALAGPAMMTVTFVVWVSAFIVGFALVVWPVIDDGTRLATGRPEPGFADALYFGGVTVTTLGYGDITPEMWWLEVLAVLAAASGFAVLTGIVTYVIQLTSSLQERMSLALRLDDETAGTGDGTGLLLTVLAEEEVIDVRSRLIDLATQVRGVHDRLHRLPMVSVFHRSADPAGDPEPAFETLVELAAAARLASMDPRLTRLAPAARGLERACARLVADLSKQYLPRRTGKAFDDPEVGEVDRQFLADVRRRVTDAGYRVPDASDADSDHDLDDTAVFLRQSRAFLDGLDEVTRWRARQANRGEEAA